MARDNDGKDEDWSFVLLPFLSWPSPPLPVSPLHVTGADSDISCLIPGYFQLEHRQVDLKLCSVINFHNIFESVQVHLSVIEISHFQYISSPPTSLAPQRVLQDSRLQQLHPSLVLSSFVFYFFSLFFECRYKIFKDHAFFPFSLPFLLSHIS